MCRRVTCRTCKLPTWAGCGAHVEQVLGDVPRERRCGCRDGAGPAAGIGPSPFKVTPKRSTSATTDTAGGSRLRRWLGR